MHAFHNDPAVKQKYQSRVEAHRIADEIVQGTGYEKNGQVRACAVGCTLDKYDHSRYPIELGLPEWLARLEDTIHEGVPLERAKLWPGQFLAAIPVGADVEKVQYRLAILRHEKQLVTLTGNKEPYADECREAIGQVIAWLRSEIDESAAWSAARSAAGSAARSAAESAWSAWSAALSAVVSAAESAWSAHFEWEADTLLALLAAA